MADLTCSDCVPRNETAYEIERARRNRDALGCEKDSPYPVFSHKDTGEQFFRCPVRSITDETWFVVDLFGFYEQGHLPVAGGLSDQSAYLMNCFSIIKSQKIKEQKES